MEIKNTRQASRAMAVAFKLTTKMIGKSDSRCLLHNRIPQSCKQEFPTTAKRLIKEAENYMILKGVKYSAGIDSN